MSDENSTTNMEDTSESDSSGSEPLTPQPLISIEGMEGEQFLHEHSLSGQDQQQPQQNQNQGQDKQSQSHEHGSDFRDKAKDISYSSIPTMQFLVQDSGIFAGGTIAAIEAGLFSNQDYEKLLTEAIKSSGETSTTSQIDKLTMNGEQISLEAIKFPDIEHTEFSFDKANILYGNGFVKTLKTQNTQGSADSDDITSGTVTEDNAPVENAEGEVVTESEAVATEEEEIATSEPVPVIQPEPDQTQAPTPNEEPAPPAPNSPAIIGGAILGGVTEDAATPNLVATGSLTISDVDSGESAFTAETINGAYGSLTIDAAGAWTYTAVNSDPSIQGLAAGQDVNDIFTVHSADGTAQNVTITLHGTNDAAVIGGVMTGAVTEDAATPNLVATGNLTISDADSGQGSFTAQTINGTYGSLTINAAGAWTYTAVNSNALIQGLSAAQVVTDTFIVHSADGTAQNVVISLNGVNDAPVIGGNTSGGVTEDASSLNLTATGTLTISDADTGQSSFTAGTINGTYGSLTINAAGAWTYTAVNSNANIQGLAAGQVVTDTFTVHSADGSAQNIVISLTGANDAPVLGGNTTGAVTEDASSPNLTASGTLTISDVDTGQSSFTAQTISGTYGSLTINAAGAWTYTAVNSNANVQGLAAGQNVNDTFTVHSADGTAQNITITLQGTNDTPVLGGVSTGSVTEDATSPNLSTSGTLTISDADSGQSSYIASSQSGTYGSLVLNTAGAWTYTASNSQSAIQALGVGQSLTDTFTVSSFDGTLRNIVITLNGVNDAPVLDISKSPVFSAIAKNASAPVGAVGNLVSSLIDFSTSSGQVDNVSDVDSGASLGIAITAKDVSHGTWYYSTNGGTTWTALPTVSVSNALLLDQNARLYFQPNNDFTGDATITFRAWDQSTGTNGSTANTTVNGGTTAFSAATDTATVTIPVPQDLFTGHADNVDFNTLIAANYAGSDLYHALGNDDTIVLPNSAEVAASWGYDVSQTFFAQGGSDTVIGSNLALNINGGGTNDTISYENVTGAGVNVNLATGSATGLTDSSKTGGSDVLSGFANITGSHYSDVLTGDDDNNVITGNGGNDTFIGGGGNDTLIGGSGDDTYVFNLNTDDSGTVKITDTGGTDTLDFHNTPTSSVIINLGSVTNSTNPSEGMSNLSFATFNNSGFAPNIENVLGGAGNDTITGNDANNMLSGNGGIDVLSGGLGADTLVGGAGADTLTGGSGSDIFKYSLTSELGDTITDFTHNADQFSFARAAFQGDSNADGNLDLSAFSEGTGPSATAAGVHFIYNITTGQLFYDADSVGGAAGVMVADTQLSGTGSLTSADIHFF